MEREPQLFRRRVLRDIHPRRQAIHLAWRHFIVFGFCTKPGIYGCQSRPGETARTHGQPISPGSCARVASSELSGLFVLSTAKGTWRLSPLFVGDPLDSYQTPRLRRYAHPHPRDQEGCGHRHGRRLVPAPDSALGPSEQSESDPHVIRRCGSARLGFLLLLCAP